MKKISQLIFVTLALLLPCVVYAQGSGYHVVNKITLGGEGGWDYLAVDSAAQRLYVSHATKVIVVDVTTGKAVGEIPNTNGVHGIALAPDLKRGFTSNGRDATVTIFDLQTLAVLGTAKTGGNPDAILYEPVTKRVFTFNRTRAAAEASTTVIDAAKGEVIKTVMLGGRPEFAQTDGNGTVFVNIDDKSEIAVIDAKTLTIKSRWPLAPGEAPSGLALDAKKRRLYAVCENKKMIVMNADNGKVLADVPIGAGTDGAAFDPGTGLAFSSNGGDGTLTVVRETAPGKFAAENIPTQRGARTMTCDPKTHRLYLPTAEFAPATGGGRPAAVPGSFMVLVLEK
ncbi:MAG: YncE family protein [Acidobacteria bacterium]|nr:YncE family protein [Acidobacteriota bacterium]MBI3425110.1 YncE family protein [Acidobacteriota bacterium]